MNDGAPGFREESFAPSVGMPSRTLGRWWTYQRERFPLMGHGVLVLTFSASAVCFSALLRFEEGQPIAWPGAPSFIVAFVACLLLFLQLRIADEFKDFDEDRRWRPYRPVQRGLVTLRELAIVFMIAALVQGLLAWWLSPWLLPLLLITWTYLALMCKEFFVGEWLRRRPLLYMLSHMCIMPLVDLLATACDWTVGSTGRPGATIGLAIFLATSYFNGLVIEMGRKIRSPADEEEGVPTYSALWGARRAVLAWLLAMTITAILATVASMWIGSVHVVAVAAGLALCAAAIVAVRFLRQSQPGGGRAIETVAGIWTVILYLSLGLIPMILATMAHGAGGGVP